MAIKIGSQCYDASEEIQNKLFKFGILIGKAFQIQDDLLEITSNPKTMKKSLDSDIVLGKKTYPMIIAQQYNQQTINELLNNTNIDIELKLKSFKEFDYSPYLLKGMVKREEGQYVLGERKDQRLPYVFTLQATKK